MTAITFPNSPSSGDTHTAGNGIVYTYDGEKWTSIGTNSAGTWTRSGTTVSLTNAGDDLNVDSGTLFVDASTDRVGVGTSSPQRPLHVDGTEGAARFTSTNSGNNGFEVGIGTSSQAFLWQSENAYMQFATNNAERMRIDSSGRLGVGTASPAAKLHLSQSYAAPTGGSAADNYFIVSNSGSANNYAGIEIAAGNNGGSYLHFSDTDDADVGVLAYIHADNSMRFNVAAAERLRIDSSGRVGIGVTDPGSYYGNGNDLVVGGGASHGITIKTGTTHQGIIAFADGTSGGSQQYAGYILYDHATNHVQFATGATERLRIDSSGNLGIGTSAPSGSGRVVDITGTGDVQLRLHNTNIGTSSSDGALFSINSAGDSYLWNYESRSTVFGTSNTERMRILSGGGLTFNGDTAQANGLDDYEEGSWTPTIGGTSGGSFTAGSQNLGRYTKIGRTVTASGTIHYTSATYSGAAYIGGLPYAMMNTTHFRANGIFPGQVNAFYATGSYNTLSAGGDTNQSFIYVIMRSDTISSGVTYSHNPGLNGSNGFIYGFSVTYQTD